MDKHLRPLPRTEATAEGRLRPVAPGVWATRDEVLGGPANTCGYLIEQPGKNLFVYSCNTIEDYYDHLDELGGVAAVVLNHRDEATPHVSTLADHYGVPVHTHQAEVDACVKRGVREIEPLSNATDLGSQVQVIPTPGHTPGTTSYLYTDAPDGSTYLFSGDTFSNFTVDKFTSVTNFHPYGDNVADMRTTLARLMHVDCDVLVPGLANGVINAYSWSTEQRHALLNHALTQLAD